MALHHNASFTFFVIAFIIISSCLFTGLTLASSFEQNEAALQKARDVFFASKNASPLRTRSKSSNSFELNIIDDAENISDDLLQELSLVDDLRKEFVHNYGSDSVLLRRCRGSLGNCESSHQVSNKKNNQPIFVINHIQVESADDAQTLYNTLSDDTDAATSVMSHTAFASTLRPRQTDIVTTNVVTADNTTEPVYLTTQDDIDDWQIFMWTWVAVIIAIFSVIYILGSIDYSADARTYAVEN